MKQVFTYITAVIMAFLVFYGGAGVNIASFCCDDCRKAGTEVLTGDKCCEIHGHSHEEGLATLDAAEGNIGHSHEMCCNLIRYSFDWDHDTDFGTDLQPLALDLLAFGTPNASLIPLPLVDEAISVMPTGPPLCPPRTYLSLLTTLLI